MSDLDAKPDPMDEAYLQAEALLSDEAARAARRAQVLAAAVREAAPAPVASRASRLRPALQRGGWLAAAGVAGLSVILATQLRWQTPLQPPSTPLQPVVSSAPAPQGPQTMPTPRTAVRRVAPPPAAPGMTTPRTRSALPASLAPAPRAFPAASPAATPAIPPPPDDVPAPPPRPTPPARVEQPKYQGPVAPVSVPSPPPPPAPPLPIPPAKVDQPKYQAPAAPASGLVGANAEPDYAVGLTGSTARRQANPALATQFASDQAPRLFSAVAAGRTAEVKALLTRGVPVDAADADGNTALMISIQADRPAVAALLRRHGASLDLTNRAGVSARDMAVAKGDSKLTQAIGLQR